MRRRTSLRTAPKAPATPAAPAAQEQEPPEEDANLKPKVYAFNPLQANKELQVGVEYFKKHSYKAAAGRFREATRWNPNLAEAWLRLGEAEEKRKNRAGRQGRLREVSGVAARGQGCGGDPQEDRQPALAARRGDRPCQIVQIASARIDPVTGKAFYIETFGCQMNAHDSEKVVGTLLAKGYTQVDTPEAADLVLYNTCSIRDKAEQKVFNRLQNFKRAAGKRQSLRRAGMRGAAGGREDLRARAARQPGGRFRQLHRLPEMLVQLEAGNRRVTGLSLDTDETFDTPFTRRDNPHRAYITIIEGCDKSCAYCVVPFTRGPERSRTSESVMAEARRLAESGYTEIQLLGQNVNSYRDPSPAGWDFATLLARTGEIPGIRRVRYTTSHPRDFTKAIVDAMDANPVLCNHVHLPVQSGSSRVLASMQRLYTRDQYMQRIALDQERAAQHGADHRHHRGLSRRDRSGFRGDPQAARRSAVRFAVQLQVLAAPEYGRAGAWRTRFPRRRRPAG